MSNKTIGIVVGSLRKNSFSKAIAKHIASILPKDYQVKFIDINNIDMYNEDIDRNPPASWLNLRKEVKDSDAYLFITPEHNRSIPAALKNALDIASRPYGQCAWSSKPAGIISTSIGGVAGFGANHHLRQILTILDVYTMQQPEAYIGNIMGILDEGGNVINEDTKKFLQGYVNAYIAWINKF